MIRKCGENTATEVLGQSGIVCYPCLSYKSMCYLAYTSKLSGIRTAVDRLSSDFDLDIDGVSN